MKYTLIIALSTAATMVASESQHFHHVKIYNTIVTGRKFPRRDVTPDEQQAALSSRFCEPN